MTLAVVLLQRSTSHAAAYAQFAAAAAQGSFKAEIPALPADTPWLFQANNMQQHQGFTVQCVIIVPTMHGQHTRNTTLNWQDLVRGMQHTT
jgi:hypothetical protein